MKIEVKKALYNHFFENIPIPFEYITDRQFAYLATTSQGATIVAACAVGEMVKEFNNKIVNVCNAINNLFEGPKK